MGHPNLSKEINDAIEESKLAGGVWLKPPQGDAVKGEPYLATGKSLHVQTANTLYIIEKRGDDEFFISGSERFCLQPVRCYIMGCNFGGSMLKADFVGRGMYLEFSTDQHRNIVTSRIVEITEV